jgi:hypothetical protein
MRLLFTVGMKLLLIVWLVFMMTVDASIAAYPIFVVLSFISPVDFWSVNLLRVYQALWWEHTYSQNFAYSVPPFCEDAYPGP